MKPQKFAKGFCLDLGCRDRKQSNFVGMDSRPNPGVNIVHDLEKFPYPLEDESCFTIKCSHLIEHIKPWLIIDFMNELWRLLLPNGQLMINAPYGNSKGFFQDPTHCTHINEQTWLYFDIYSPIYNHYRPKPWKVEHISFKPDGNIECVMRKMLEPSKEAGLVEKAMLLGAIQKQTELDSMLRFIQDKPLKTIVEIGTARGGVLYALCQLAPEDALIVSVDLPNGPFGSGFVVTDDQTFQSFARGSQQLHFLRKDSHRPSTKKELLKILDGKKIDFLFIDGDHTYPGVKADWEMYSPLVRKGGIVAFHDIMYHPKVPDCQVDKLWKEIKDKYVSLEFIDPNDPTWAGIGVISLEGNKKTKQQNSRGGNKPKAPPHDLRTFDGTA